MTPGEIMRACRLAEGWSVETAAWKCRMTVECYSLVERDKASGRWDLIGAVFGLAPGHLEGAAKEAGRE